jgi:hypothetical protein
VGLAACVALHSVEGVNVIWRTWFRSRSGVGKWRWRMASALGGALAVLSGVWVVAREPVWAVGSSVNRFETAFMESLFFRL